MILQPLLESATRPPEKRLDRFDTDLHGCRRLDIALALEMDKHERQALPIGKGGDGAIHLVRRTFGNRPLQGARRIIVRLGQAIDVERRLSPRTVDGKIGGDPYQPGTQCA